MGNLEKYGVAALAVIVLMILVISILDFRDRQKPPETKGGNEGKTPTAARLLPEGSNTPASANPIQGEFPFKDDPPVAAPGKHGEDDRRALSQTALPNAADTAKREAAKGPDKGSAKSSQKSSRPIKYKIRKEDTLWELAKKFYGDATQWKRIYDHNRKVIKSKDQLTEGVEIEIP